MYSSAKGCGQSSNLQASCGTQILLWPRERAGTQKQRVYNIVTLTCPPAVLSPQFGLCASETFHGGENQSESLFAPHVLNDQKAIREPVTGNSSCEQEVFIQTSKQKLCSQPRSEASVSNSLGVAGFSAASNL